MEKHFCDACGDEILKWSETTPVSFNYGTTHCMNNNRKTIFGEVCEKCSIKIIKAIKDVKRNIHENT